MSEGKKGKF